MFTICSATQEQENVAAPHFINGKILTMPRSEPWRASIQFFTLCEMKHSADLKRWAIAERVNFEETTGGLLRIAVTTPAAHAHIFLHGAHLSHYQPTALAPVLFMSASSLFAPTKPIRGGVPVIFPWFGPRADQPSSPPHGFARTSEWELESTRNIDDQSVQVVLRFPSTAATRAEWPHNFVLRHRITIGARLQMELEVENRGAGDLRFEEALHTYFAVSDVREVAVRGLAGTEYIDKVDGAKLKVQDEEPIRFTGETDRVYLDTSAECTIDDPGLQRRISIQKTGSDTTVVWNPWVAKAAALADFGDDEWPRMLCVETANAHRNAVTLKPAGTHVMSTVIAVSAQGATDC